MWSPRVFASVLVGLALALTVISSSSIAGAVDARPQADTEVPQVLRLPAPFECGTVWSGSTYGGHGSNNWNLDLNRADRSLGTDHGMPLFAQDNGVVVWFKPNGYNNRAGTYIEIDYGDVSVRYLHLVADSIPAEVAEIGASVEKGQLIGLLGDTGRASGPHLHLEYWDSTDMDHAAWFELPAGRHIPVVFDGEPQVATPGSPTDPHVSTNCTGDAAGEHADVEGRTVRAGRPARAS